MERSKLAVAAAFFAGLGLFDAVLGPLLIRFGLLSPMTGFNFWLMGSLAGLIAVVLGLLGIRATAAGKKLGRNLALFGLVGGGVLAALFFINATGGSDYPPINDITTDLEDPPAFASDPAERERDMEYPPDFIPQVKAAYPDLAPRTSAEDPARAFELVEETAAKLGWEIVSADLETRTLLARQTTPIFRFVDDVVVRVRPGADGGSVIDLRSKSRDGRGDIGANAIRIRAFLEAYPG